MRGNRTRWEMPERGRWRQTTQSLVDQAERFRFYSSGKENTWRVGDVRERGWIQPGQVILLF